MSNRSAKREAVETIERLPDDVPLDRIVQALLSLAGAHGAQQRREQWLAGNREAIDSANEWIAKHGLILDKYRLF